ncbi:Short-chain dehydrogenase [Luteibacter sp. UNCMF331Sha3.1]|uniref:SDR family oxidoreductase n=1 Tax=Luteibacter sp. UNCMF331Sha3.1 TaxID=1502760 RepID=UPI0008C80799|nr:SDR family oxidoreductase [Luteibacter sp. UNCMF331Sha3.1]SEM18924.1 Short-chain dehydrogenase [Luteibacter sp. UNCMF331Sha3.1]
MNHQDRVTLVTGANKGIGLEVARQLGKAGHRILLGARDAGRGQAAEATLRGEGIDVRFIRLDLADEASLARAAADIEANEGRIDVLVNNAGVAIEGDGNVAAANLDAVKRVFDTNYFGTVAVTQALLPLVKKSAAGRIINVSSRLGSITYNADPTWDFAAVKLVGYNASKAALNMFSVILADEVRNDGITVHVACPGYTATDLNGNSGTQTLAEGAEEIVRLASTANAAPTGSFTGREGPAPW